MSTYNNNRYTPGNKANLKLFLNKEYIKQYYGHNVTKTNIINVDDVYDEIAGDFLCNCITSKSNLNKQGWNDPSQTENMRISQILTGTLGGRTTFGNGNLNNPIRLNELGGWYGQPGGSPKPLRNKF